MPRHNCPADAQRPGTLPQPRAHAKAALTNGQARRHCPTPMPRHNCPIDAQRPGTSSPMTRHVGTATHPCQGTTCPVEHPCQGTTAQPMPNGQALRHCLPRQPMPNVQAHWHCPPPPTHARAPHPRRCPASKHVGIASRPCQGTTRQNNAFLENLDGQTAFGSLEMARSRKNDQIKKKFVENGQPSAKLRQFKVSLSATRFFTIQVNKG